MSASHTQRGWQPDLLATPRGRRVLFATLYMSEGAPIGFLWWALPTRLREAGAPLAEITLLTSLLALPWALKFLWAPLVDTLRGPRWTRRAWVIAPQLLMGLLLLPLLWLDLQEDLTLVTILLLAHALAAATQDVAVDALCIASVPAAERGSLNGWMQAGMLAGRSLLGGAALIIAARIGDRGLVLALIAVIWFSSALLLCSRATPQPASTTGALSFLARLAAVTRRRNTWLGLAFAGTAGVGFEAVGAVAGPFLVDRGAAADEVGWFFTLVSVPCMIGGALLGGAVCDRVGKRRAVRALFLALTATIVALAAIDARLPAAAPALRMAVLGGVYTAIGLFTAASYALLMDLTDTALAATQFSAYMALTNVCESGATLLVGRLAPACGYPFAFVTLAAVSLLSLEFLRAMDLPD